MFLYVLIDTVDPPTNEKNKNLIVRCGAVEQMLLLLKVYSKDVVCLFGALSLTKEKYYKFEYYGNSFR